MSGKRPEKASRAGTARRLVEQGQKVQRKRTSVRRSVPRSRLQPGDMGRYAVHEPERVGSTPKPFSSSGGEATVKACGVTMAMLPE